MDIIDAGRDAGGREPLQTASGRTNESRHTGNQSRCFSKLKLVLAYDPAIYTFPGPMPKELHILI